MAQTPQLFQKNPATVAGEQFSQQENNTPTPRTPDRTTPTRTLDRNFGSQTGDGGGESGKYEEKKGTNPNVSVADATVRYPETYHLLLELGAMPSSCLERARHNPAEEVRWGERKLAQQNTGKELVPGRLIGMLKRGDCREGLLEEKQKGAEKAERSRLQQRVLDAKEFFQRVAKCCPVDEFDEYRDKVNVIKARWPQPEDLVGSNLITDNELEHSYSKRSE